MLSSCIYSGILKYCFPSWFDSRMITTELLKRMFLISVLFFINIVLANYSLRYCSLALDQVHRPFLIDRDIDGSLYSTSMDNNSSILYYW